MQKITNAADLKIAIQQLEDKQAREWSLLKQEFLTTSEGLQPVTIIKNTFKELIAGVGAKTNNINTAIGLTTGIVAWNFMTGKTNNLLRKFLGVVAEMAVVTKVVENADGIKAIVSIFLKKIFRRRRDQEKV
ncbi:MAG TPA: hypothetical protein VET23_00275 [Chitinophagaceae bacterium]|nr:hypothetical protein [Chitinophagaceae bacterium]